MDLTVGATDILIRLAAAFAAAFVIGLNREEHGRPAGLRTTLLVGLAAAGSMVLANVLLDTSGKQGDSFGAMDVMRLPLGVLTGMGFIGAGAILHRENLVVGVTTAATLWFATIMGFCFGAGEFFLGWILLILAGLILWVLKWMERVWKERHEATLRVRFTVEAPAEEKVRELIQREDYRIFRQSVLMGNNHREIRWEITWQGRHAPISTPDFVRELSQLAGVERVVWLPR